MPTPRDLVNRSVHGRVVHLHAQSNESVIADYVAYRTTVGRRWRPETVRSRTVQLRLISEAIYPVLFVDATEEDILAWHRGRTGTAETICAYTSAIHGLYRWMTVQARPRLRVDDPTVILERPHIPPAQPRPMLDRHYDLALACSVSDPEMYLWLGLMGCSGLRCCEIAWMQVSDVEPLEDGGGLLHITGKGGKQRTTIAGAMLMLTMKPFLRGRGPVFTRQDGKAYTPKDVSRKVALFLDEIGVPAPNRAHSLRHRFGTDYHAIDADLYRQAQLMGHASVATTQRYTQISPLEAAKFIDELTTKRLRSGLRRAA